MDEAACCAFLAVLMKDDVVCQKLLERKLRPYMAEGFGKRDESTCIPIRPRIAFRVGLKARTGQALFRAGV